MSASCIYTMPQILYLVSELTADSAISHNLLLSGKHISENSFLIPSCSTLLPEFLLVFHLRIYQDLL